MVNFRNVASRLTHLDAEFVSFQGYLPDGGATYAVKYYPWWEHPQVVEAIREEKPWRIRDDQTGATVVTVHAREVHEMKISTITQVEGFDFFEEHPLLWSYEHNGPITCNAPLSLEEAMEIVEAAAPGVTGARTSSIWPFVDHRNIRRYGKTPPFSLGSFPRPAFLGVRAEMQRRGIAFSAPFEPKERQKPVLFLIDDDDYIIAMDFEIDLPEFEHRPEWFSPD